MSQVIRILFGAAFTLAVCVAFGRLLIRSLRFSLFREEAALFAFLAGSACLQVVIFALCLFHFARLPVIAAIGTAAIGAAAIRREGKPEAKSLPKPSKRWLAFFLAIYAAFFVAYFFNALAPEVSADGTGYHLGNVFRMWRQGGFAWNYHSMYSHMPQGMEMLFLVAYSFGGPSSAALVHFAFFSTLPLLMICYACRFEFPRAGIFAAVLVYAAPVCGIAGTSAYNDLALATLIFAVFYLLQLSNYIKQFILLIIIGLLAGECFAIKYTGALIVPFTGCMLMWQYRKACLRPLVIAGAAAAAVALPWVIRNWVWLGNPAAPFLNAWFPNPYYTAALEHGYLADLATYPHFKHYWDLPLDFILFGRALPGFIGPGFLLAPVALLALRSRQGRRLLLAALVFAIPIRFNAAVRFLVPSLSFLSLAMGIGMSEWWGGLAPAALAHAVLCWPALLTLYCASWAWRLSDIPVRAALRLEPETQFIQKRLGDYAWKEPLERLVPPDALVFTDAGRPEAYIDRTLLVGYESLLGSQAQQALWAPLSEPSLRQSAAKKLRELGFSYFMLNDTSPVAQDLKEHLSLWPVTVLAEVNGARLYRLN